MIEKPIKGQQRTRARINWNKDQADFVDSVQSTIIWVGVGASFLAFFLSYILSKHIANPIQKLTKITRDIAQGKDIKEITIHSNDEIGDLECSLKTMYEQLKKIEDIRKDLITNFSHEMSTPLTSIHGYLEAMEDGMLKTKEDKETALRIMKEQANRLIKMVRDLRDLSRYESNSVPVNKMWIEFPKWFDTFLKELKPILDKKSCNISIQSHPEKMRIFTDPSMLHTILLNLMDNAIKYSEPNCEIQVKIVEDKSSGFLFEIKNPGPPFSEQDKQHLFERFYRGQNAKQQAILGNGIGLSIVKDIVSKLSGDIHYFYTSDSKHLFRVRIPPTPVMGK